MTTLEVALQREFRRVSELMNNSQNNRIDAENKAVHGSCLRNTRARLLFPVMTGVTTKGK